jgi:hypothetical protein
MPKLARKLVAVTTLSLAAAGTLLVSASAANAAYPACQTGAIRDVGSDSGWAKCISGEYRVVLTCKNIKNGTITQNYYGDWRTSGASWKVCGTMEPYLHSVSVQRR